MLDLDAHRWGPDKPEVQASAAQLSARGWAQHHRALLPARLAEYK